MIDKRPTRVAGMFDGIAARYDLLNHLLSAGLDRGWRVRAVRSLRLSGTQRVVDVCAGTADVAMAAVLRGGASRVVGVDFSGEMLRLGQAKLRTSGLDRRVWLVRGDAVRLPARAESMDAATVAFGIRNVEAPERALAELHRVLRPGGRVAILEFSIPRSAAVRAVYLPYFQHVLPRIGRLISGHGTAYSYLPASVGSFVPPERMAAMLEAVGFSGVEARPLTLGIVTLFTAVKRPGSGGGAGPAGS